MQKEKKDKKVRLLCILLLFTNAFIRLLLSYGSFHTPIGASVATTGIIALIVGIIDIFLRNEEWITAFALAFVMMQDAALCRIIPLQQNVFLMISTLSLVSIGIAIYIEEKKKYSIYSIKRKPKAALIVLMLFLSTVSIFSVNASEIVDHRDLTSSSSKFKVSVYVYKYEDIMQSKDFYGFWILLHSDEIPYFDWVDIELLCCTGSVIDDWQPREGLTTGGNIGLTPSGPSVSIAFPLSDIKVNGKYTNKISWFVNPLLNNPQDLEFATKLWCPTGTPLYWKLHVLPISGVTFLFCWHECWRDSAELSTFPINLQVCGNDGGTTNYSQGIYSYERPTTITITAIPSESTEFWKWELTSTKGVKKVYFDNPLTLTVNNGSWSLKCFFKRSLIWVTHRYYQWRSVLVYVVCIEDYDMSWKYIGCRTLRWIENYW
jgi:hypothetical protein